jgi:hypothetical protein
MSEPTKFEQWCLVEIMGHVRLAGLCSEASHFGTALLRVDVPEVTLAGGETIQAFTRFFGGSSIYSITPVSEETARCAAVSYQTKPVQEWDIRQAADALLKQKALPAAVSGSDLGRGRARES